MTTNIACLVLHTNEPIVLVNMISDWEQLKWTQDEWSTRLGDGHFPFRVGHSRCSSMPLWETTCLMEQLTMKTFFRRSECDPEISAPYGNRWMYFDYKHMGEWFETESSLLKRSEDLPACFFCCKRRVCHGQHSGSQTRRAETRLSGLEAGVLILLVIWTPTVATWWPSSMGRWLLQYNDVVDYLALVGKPRVPMVLVGDFNISEESKEYLLKHFLLEPKNDSAEQIRKCWIMFPPSAKQFLEPSRVPYEESSIYSSINFSCGCSNLKNIREEARVVMLNPGDILVVPKHWWHYVENLSTAISINTWIPLPSDDESRLEESLVRCFISSFVHHLPQLVKQVILNPNEDDLTESCIDVELIKWCVERHEEQNRVKNIKIEQKESEAHLANILQTYSSVVRTVPKMAVTELKKLLVEKCSRYKLTVTEHKQSGSIDKQSVDQQSGGLDQQLEGKDGLIPSLTAHHIINAFCDPDVISLVKAKLLHQVRQDIGDRKKELQ